METRHPRPSPQGLASQNDAGLWLKTDSNPLEQTDSPSVPCSDNPSNETGMTPPAPIARYYSVMDDEGADEVFIPPPPPSYMAPLLPAESSTDAMVTNPSVTLANGASGATEAKGNPNGLDWHGERQLMAAQNQVDEVKAGTKQIPMDIVSLDSQDQSAMEDRSNLRETCYDLSERHHQDINTGDEESSVESGIILTGGQENQRETEGERGKHPKQVPINTEENSDNEAHFDKEEDKTATEIIHSLAETDSKPTENTDCDILTMTSLRLKDDDGPPELCKSSPNKMETAINQPQVPEIPTAASKNDEEYVDTRSFDYNLTKYDWVRRASGTGETFPQLPISGSFEETMPKGEQEDDSRSIATDIQQGEQLLQRLQQVQLRQDECTPENPHISQQVVQETRGETKGAPRTEENLKGGYRDDKGESRSCTVDDEEEKTNRMEKENNEKNENKDVETKAGVSSSALPAKPEHGITARTEAGDSNDSLSDNWVPEDLSPIDSHETFSPQGPFLSTAHRLSATETSIERQLHEAAQEKQNLQRASGLFNLAENSDVLEIPFKSNISLEPLSTVAGPSQRSDWQFSEQKMQKEISQEIQRELVLVNQGKIPGGYSKGEVRQLKETKLLFEAFQQDNTEGPTRYRKSPTLFMKGHVYPSVLERTRSLEMFSDQSHPVSRAHSLRLYISTSEAVKSPEDFRSKSPTGGSRDKSRLVPYPKQDKHLRLYRSMDSISTDTSAVEIGNKGRQGIAKQGSPIIKQNPFCKLRPSLALQPEVAKDIREAKEREEELRRQRSTLYGENRQRTEDGEKSRSTTSLEPDPRRQSRGKLERVWPPPSKKDQTKSEQTQQEPRVHRAGRQKAALWQRWEAGLVNGQPSKENN